HGSGHDQIDLAANQLGSQRRQPLIVVFRPAVFDRQVVTLDVAGFAQSLTERGSKRPPGGLRARAEEANHRHRLLLRAGGQRPGRSTAEQRYEIATFHLRSSRRHAISLPTRPPWPDLFRPPTSRLAPPRRRG